MSRRTLEPGEVHEARGLRLNDEGDGVAAVRNMTVFVPQLLPGETADVKITEVRHSFARASILKLRSDGSPVRTVPDCAVYGACGGCQLQHVDYAQQLEHKTGVVAHSLRRVALAQKLEVRPTLGMDVPWRYRNQVQVPLAFDRDLGHLVSGFFATGSHQHVPTAECRLEPVEMEATVREATEVLNEFLLHQGPVQGQGQAGRFGVHHLIVRQSMTTGEQLLVLCVREASGVWSEVAERLGQLQSVVSVHLTVQPKATGPVWGQQVSLLWGKPYLMEQVLGLWYLISARSFFQVNTSQTAVLYQTALDFANLQPADVVVDAYCGTGTMSLLFARRAKQVIGIESIGAAVDDARRNAEYNHVENAEFHTGTVESVLPKLVRDGLRFDVLVLDPPRKGCDERVLQTVQSVQPKRIVYVSCNHATLARDLDVLMAAGYHVTSVQPVDMFPQTSHVETVVALER